jgi:hypothetical protein
MGQWAAKSGHAVGTDCYRQPDFLFRKSSTSQKTPDVPCFKATLPTHRADITVMAAFSGMTTASDTREEDRRGEFSLVRPLTQIAN